MISSAARNRVKLSIDQMEELFHRHDDRASGDVNDSYAAALQLMQLQAPADSNFVDVDLDKIAQPFA